MLCNGWGDASSLPVDEKWPAANIQGMTHKQIEEDRLPLDEIVLGIDKFYA